MSKIDLDPITSGYNLSKINANFQKVEDELNNKVLYRDSPAGEPNSMSSNLDMNSKSILNANKISSNILELGGVQVVPTNLATDPYNGTREALRRSYAEAGYNLVAGSFEAGGTLVNANDVLLHEASGKAFSGPAGAVAAGTNPVGGGFVDESSKTYSCFKTVAEMKASPMVIGQPVQWLGYYAPMDGGGNSGIVSARGSLVEDGGSVFFVAGNLAVVAKESKSFHIRQFGAKYDDALFDNGPIFKKIAEINKSCYMDNTGIIHASTGFDCPSYMASMLGNATIKITGNLPKIVKPITKFKSVGFSSDVVTRFANNAPSGDKEVIIDGGMFDKFKITAYQDTTGITKLTMKNWWEIKNVDTSNDVIEVDSSDYVITQGTIIGGREGIKSNKASQGGEITHLDISGCFRDAIDVYTGGKRVIITHNKLHNNTGGGLDLKVATDASLDRLHSRESIVGFNICHDNAKQGLTVSAPFISVVSNQCSNNGEYGILAGQAPDAFGSSFVANTCTNNGREGILISQPNSIVNANQLMDNDKVNIGGTRVQLRAETGCTNGVILSNVLGYTVDEPLADNRGIFYSGVGDIVKDNQFRFVQKSKQVSGSRQSAKIMRDNGENSMRSGNTSLRPTAPAEFEPYYNTDTSKIERFIGGVWV